MEIDNYLNRPKSYYNIDGVGELGIGFMCLAFALLQWLQVSSPKDSIWNGMHTLFLYVGLMSLIIHYGSKAIKKHITYPRTGFVEYRKDVTFWRPLVITFCVSALVSIALVAVVKGRVHVSLTTPVALFGLVFAAIYGRNFAKAARWKWIVAFLMGLGSLAIAMLPEEFATYVIGDSRLTAQFPSRLMAASLLSFSWYGIVLLISGAVSFYEYVRHHPLPPQDAE